MRLPDLKLDIEIAALQASQGDPDQLGFLLELRERRSWWVARLWDGVALRMVGPSVARWCLVIALVTFAMGAWAAAVMPTRTLSALLAGTSITFLALGLLLRPQDFRNESLPVQEAGAGDIAKLEGVERHDDGTLSIFMRHHEMGATFESVAWYWGVKGDWVNVTGNRVSASIESALNDLVMRHGLDRRKCGDSQQNEGRVK